MSVQYKRFLKLLEKWPIDKTKTGRDFGEHLRERLQTTIRSANITNFTDEILDRNYEALDRLANNIYATKYNRSNHSSTATGLSGEQCNQVLSSEFLEYLNQDSRKK